MRQLGTKGLVALVCMAVPALLLGGSFWLIEGWPAWSMFAGGAAAGLFLYWLGAVYVPRQERRQ